MTSPYYYETILLNSMNGANGTISPFIDYSYRHNTASVNGSPVFSNAQAKFGTTSLSLPGSGAYVAVAISFNPGNKASFTIDGWVRHSSLTGVQTHCYVGSGQPTLRKNASNQLEFNWGGDTIAGGTMAINTWHHVALVVDWIGPAALTFQPQARIYLDGVQVAAALLVGAGPSTSQLQYGAGSAGTNSMTGFMQDWRLVLGLPLYSANFTPPASANDTAPGTINKILSKPFYGIFKTGAVPAVHYKTFSPAINLRDMSNSGGGKISGTTKIDGTPDVPVSRRVRLYREQDGSMIAEQWSIASTGAYAFNNVSLGQTYTVITYDHLHNYRAVVADNLTPDPMP